MNSVLAAHESWCKSFQLLKSVSLSLQLDVITHSSCISEELGVGTGFVGWCSLLFVVCCCVCFLRAGKHKQHLAKTPPLGASELFGSLGEWCFRIGPHTCIFWWMNLIQFLFFVDIFYVCRTRGGGVAEIVFHINAGRSTEFANTKVVTPNVSRSLTLCNQLGGGFKYFYFHPYLGKWSNLTSIFFKWVGSTTN